MPTAWPAKTVLKLIFLRPRQRRPDKPPPGISSRTQDADPDRKLSISIAICFLGIILTLVIGVGLAGGLMLRHVVQTLPMWFGVALEFRYSRATGWVGRFDVSNRVSR
jgi:hypothetical protein